MAKSIFQYKNLPTFLNPRDNVNIGCYYLLLYITYWYHLDAWCIIVLFMSCLYEIKCMVKPKVRS